MGVRSFAVLVMGCLACSCSAFVTPAALPAQCASRSASVSMIAKTKPQRTNIRRRAYNLQYKSEMKTRIKSVLVAADNGDYASASAYLNAAQSIIDKNVKRNLLHKNTAARKKSLLTMKVKALEPGAAPAEVALQRVFRCVQFSPQCWLAILCVYASCP